MQIPVLYEEKSGCCGCSACYAICPKRAIYMVKDDEGFEYPHINIDLCIGCLMCLRVCPFKEDTLQTERKRKPKKE